MLPNHKKPQRKQNSKKYAGAVKFSGLAFEMAAVIALGVLGGIQVDKKFDSDPVFTLILSLLGVFAAIYFAIKNALKDK